MPKVKVLAIVGPTASGKSDLAIRLAKLAHGKQFKKIGIHGAEIISADSRQVYIGLDIGTGKITKREMRGIPHHLLDVVNPKKQFTVSEFVSKANEALKLIEANEALPIVVGGTGFYIDALTGATAFPNVGPNKKLREKLDKKSTEALFKILKKKDPKRAATIDPHNKVRLIRALEIVESLGKVPGCQSARSTPYKFIYIGLKPNDLDKRIYRRLLARLDGIIREVKKLIKLKAISYRRMHQLGLEYRYIGLYLQGKLSKQEMVDKLYIEIKRYAKRQMTWFRRNKKIKWFRPEEYKRIERYARMALLGLP